MQQFFPKKVVKSLGAFSPFVKLEQENGKILFLGTPVKTMTFFHTVEELLESEMPFSPFTKEHYTLQTIDTHGNLVTSRLRLFDPYHSARRDERPFVLMLKEKGWWREGRIKRLKVICLKAEDVVATFRLLVSKGIYPYKL